MGKLYVLVVGYVLLGFSSCAPPKKNQDVVSGLLESFCHVKDSDKILPEACKREGDAKVPAECELIIEYTTRLCKQEGFAFNLTANSQWKCPLNLPPIEHKDFKTDNKTRVVMERLSNVTLCTAECTGKEIFCSRLAVLGSMINRTKNPAPTPVPTPKPKDNPPPPPKTDTTPPPPKPQPIKPNPPESSGKNEPQETKPEAVAPKIVPDDPEVDKDAGKTSKTEGKPVEPQEVAEDPGAEQPEGKLPDNVDLDDDSELEPNTVGSQRQDDYHVEGDPLEPQNKIEKPRKPSNTEMDYAEGTGTFHGNGVFQEAPDSHFFVYFLFFTCVSVIGYIAFHNKNKLLALALEGRRGRQGRRRPNSASYRKLDNNLEEAITSNPSRVSNSSTIY